MLVSNTVLYKKVKAEADKKFGSKTGIYKSAWIIREYKKRGGDFIGKRDKSKGLLRWFKEKWVDLNRPIKNLKGKIIGYEPCGRTDMKSQKYPLCRPSKIITKDTPRTYKQISKASIIKAKNQKSRVKGMKNVTFDL